MDNVETPVVVEEKEAVTADGELSPLQRFKDGAKRALADDRAHRDPISSKEKEESLLNKSALMMSSKSGIVFTSLATIMHHVVTATSSTTSLARTFLGSIGVEEQRRPHAGFNRSERIGESTSRINLSFGGRCGGRPCHISSLSSRSQQSSIHRPSLDSASWVSCVLLWVLFGFGVVRGNR
jgi:hypothetical protein